VLMAVCVNFFFFKTEIIVASFLILAISDASAALIGKRIKSSPFFEKSLAGSTAFFLSALLVLFGCGIFFNSPTWFYIFGIIAVAATTVIEARPSLFNIDDNFSIPVGFALILTMFDLAWNYVF